MSTFPGVCALPDDLNAPTAFLGRLNGILEGVPAMKIRPSKLIQKKLQKVEASLDRIVVGLKNRHSDTYEYYADKEHTFLTYYRRALLAELQYNQMREWNL